MKKVFFQFILITATFFGSWLLLSQVDWMTLLRIKKMNHSTEQKLGSVFWDIFSATEKEVTEGKDIRALDTLVTEICKSNGFDRQTIKLHLLEKDDINAFTLPDDYLVVFSGLLKACHNEAELSGVLCHEIAHMQKDHVMKKLVKEVGLSVLISITSGGGGDVARQVAKTLSSTAYDRDMEREADQTAVDYLIKTGIDPEPFANFLYRLSEKEKGLPEQVYWISTHPESKERAEALIKYMKNKPVKKRTILKAYF